MKSFSKSIEENFKEYNTNKNGLSFNEVKSRQQKYGKNELKEEKRESIFKKFLRQISDIMVVILIICGIISICISIYHSNYQDLFEGILILLIVFINALIGVYQEGKAESCLLELKKNTQMYSKVKRENKIISIPSSEITLGDIVVFESGDIVPCDVRLTFCKDLKIDESLLTGESESVLKNEKIILNDKSVLSSHVNMCYSGTIVVNGHGEGICVNIGTNTELGKIADNITSSKKELSPLQKKLNQLNEIISFVVLLICATIYLIEVFKGNDSFLNAFLTAITLAVAAVPESLPMVTSTIMALGINRLSKNKVIVKRLPTIETLGSCEIICTDKTGTITMNKMKIEEIYLPKNNNTFLDKEDSYDYNKLLKCMILNNNCIISEEKILGDSTEKALIEYALKIGINVNNFQKNFPYIDEIPFSSERKMMTTIVKEKFITGYTKGSVEMILKKCNYILINGVIEKLSQSKKKEILLKNSLLCKKSLRVLGFCYKECINKSEKENIEEDMIFIGMVAMFDPPRENVKKSIEECKKAGLSVIMITGDHKDTAFSIAKMLNICSKEDEVVTGEELNNISDNTLSGCINKFKVFARVNPEHKVRIVSEYQKQGKIVAMTGDGVNDAPSLKKANIGVGMGQNGTEVAKSASDMIITDDNFSTIVSAIKEGRKIFQNIQKTISFLFSTNLVEVITIFLTSIFFPEFIFLLPSQLLFINLVTDGLPALSLGFEKAEKNIMDIPPRKNQNSLFTKKEVASIFIQALYQVAVLMVLYILGLKFLDESTTTTMCFFTFSLMQINHSYNLKSFDSIFKNNIFDNKYLNFSYLFCIGLNLLIIFIPFLREIFNLEMLSLTQWLIVLILSFSIIPFVEFQKLIFKKISKN